jgi:hypothetical protein
MTELQIFIYKNHLAWLKINGLQETYTIVEEYNLEIVINNRSLVNEITLYNLRYDIIKEYKI